MELENFGLNLLTMACLGTFVITLMRFWAMIEQIRTMWRLSSALSISTMNVIIGIVAYGSAIGYGLEIGSVALIFNGVMMLIVTVPVLIGLRRFGGWRRADTASLAVTLAVTVAFFILPGKGVFFAAIGIGCAILCAHQPWVIWRNRDGGAVEPKMLWVNLASNIFWETYSIASGNVPMNLTNPIFLLVGISSIVLWYRYRPAAATR